MTENSRFEYNYSAEQQAEIKKIREKYTPQKKVEDKMTRLRRLDASATQAANASSLAMGIIGALVFGFGMSLCMTDFGSNLMVDKNGVMVIGIIVGIVGGVIAGLAYPVHNLVLKAKRKKLAPEIIRLSDELMK